MFFLALSAAVCPCRYHSLKVKGRVGKGLLVRSTLVVADGLRPDLGRERLGHLLVLGLHDRGNVDVVVTGEGSA